MGRREEAIKVLNAELACVSRDCDRNCSECDLVMDRDWLIRGLNDAVDLLSEPVKTFAEHYARQIDEWVKESLG